MNGCARASIMAGAMALLLGVLAGAFGAHALAQRLTPAMLGVFRTAVDYQLVHGLGLILVGLLADRAASTRLLAWAAACMTAGIVLFSGSLYLLALGAPRNLGVLAPVGGTAFLVAWALVGLSAWRSR